MWTATAKVMKIVRQLCYDKDTMLNPSINQPTIIFIYRQVKTVFVQKADMFPLVSLTTLHERVICEIPEHVIQF